MQSVKISIWLSLLLLSSFLAFTVIKVEEIIAQTERSDMEFFEVVKKRHSYRVYQDRPVEKEKIAKLLRVANSAPSAGNLQAYKIFLVKNENKRKQLARAAHFQEFVGKAPVVFVFCASPEESAVKYGPRGKNLYCIQDATVAASYLHLAAVALGLGSVMVGAFDEIEVKKTLDIDENLKPVIIIPLGYPKGIPVPTTRKELNVMVKEM